MLKEFDFLFNFTHLSAQFNFAALVAIFGLVCGCVTTELPVPANASGEWQRPIDLKLQPQSEGSTGSLSGLKLKIDCAIWSPETNQPRLVRDELCHALEMDFTSLGAITGSSESNAYDLNIRVLKGQSESISCGLGGWLTYLSLSLIPCKTQIWQQGQLQLIDKAGTTVAHFPLNFHSVRHFGVIALYVPSNSKKINNIFNLRLRKYIINRTFTLAAQKHLVKVAK